MGKTLIVPGLNGSGPGHWQHWWLRNDRDAVLVEQDEYLAVAVPRGVGRAVLAAVEAHPDAMLVAHSLGVPLVTRLAAERRDLRVAGALLVAPADVEEMGLERGPAARLRPHAARAPALPGDGGREPDRPLHGVPAGAGVRGRLGRRADRLR